MQVVRCCIEHAASVAKTFLTSNAVVIDRMELEQPLQRRKHMTMPRKPMAMPRMPMTNSGIKVGCHLKIVLIHVVIIFLILKIYQPISIILSFLEKKILFQKIVKDFTIFLYISHPPKSSLPLPSPPNSQTKTT